MTDSLLRVFIFAGTREGREFVEAFVRRARTEREAGIPGHSWYLRVYTATPYGAELLDETVLAARGSGAAVEILAGRLSGAALRAEFEQYRPCFVVDCTHPHALEISGNLKNAAAQTGTEYLRLKRGETDSLPYQNAVWVDTLSEAARRLRERKGNILLTTGSKELAPFTGEAFSGRVYVRVLPVEESLSQCRIAGFSPAHIIAMQGPFSEALNSALLKEINAAYLVTKESGKTGGFDEKINAAVKTGVETVIIRRPYEIDELSVEAVLDRMWNGTLSH